MDTWTAQKQNAFSGRGIKIRSYVKYLQTGAQINTHN